jgi:hypothetical protein
MPPLTARQSFTIHVNNVAPAITASNLALSTASIRENDRVTLTGSFADPGVLDTHIVNISWGDGSPGTQLNLAANVLVFSAPHQYVDNPAGGQDTILVTVTDKDGSQASASTTINISDASLHANSTPITVAQGTTATNVSVATFSDDAGAEPVANYTATSDWGDGLAAGQGVINVAGSAFTVTSTHTFLAPGRYTPKVTIRDAGGAATTVTGSAVIGDANERFVAQAYLDLLRRPADPAGLLYWAGALDENILSRDLVTQSFVTSLEYRTLLVEQQYQNFLHRGTDAGGLRFWVNYVATGGAIEDLKSYILGSREYFALAGGTNTAYLQRVYLDAVGRPSDPGGLVFWLSLLNSGALSRSDVAKDFVTLSEPVGHLIAGFYQTYLRRAAQQSEIDLYSSLLQRKILRDEDVVRMLVATDEYFARL